MKNILLTLLVCSIAANHAFPQISKGAKTIGGNIAFSKSNKIFTTNIHNHDFEENLFKITFSPAFSYFIYDNLSLGFTLPFSYERQIFEHEFFQSRESKQINISGGPVIRYYIPFNSWSVFPFGSIGYGYQYLEIPEFDPHYGNSISTINGTTFFYNIGVGTVYFITEKIGLEGLLFYQYQKLINDDFEDPSEKENSINFNVGLQFYLL